MKLSQNYQLRQYMVFTKWSHTLTIVSNENSTLGTSQLIIKLESKLLSRFDNLDKEMLNLKNVIIKELQFQNQRLHNKINNLEKK